MGYNYKLTIVLLALIVATVIWRTSERYPLIIGAALEVGNAIKKQIEFKTLTSVYLHIAYFLYNI